MLRDLIKKLKEDNKDNKENNNNSNNNNNNEKIFYSKRKKIEFLRLGDLDNKYLNLNNKIICLSSPLPKVFCIKNWINIDQEKIILENILRSSYRNVKLNGRMTQVWGGKVTENGIEDKEDLPEWLYSISKSLVKSKFFLENNFPNHVLINQYDFNKGILPHKDGPLYFPKVAIISLESDTIFDFWDSNIDNKLDFINEYNNNKPLFSIFVPRFSLLIFQDECYKTLLHGISSKDEYNLKDYNIVNINEFPHLNKDSIIKKGFRTSLTFRFVPKKC